MRYTVTVDAAASSIRQEAFLGIQKGQPQETRKTRFHSQAITSQFPPTPVSDVFVRFGQTAPSAPMTINQLYGDVKPIIDEMPDDQSKYIHPDVYRLIQATPKVTLHNHGRGGLDIGFLRSQIIENPGYDPKLATSSLRELRSFFRFPRPNLGAQGYDKLTLAEYIRVYDKSASLAKTLATNYLAAYMFTIRNALENVRYFEYRFVPLSLNPTSKEPIDPKILTFFVQRGIEDARLSLGKLAIPVDYGLIFSAYRHIPNDEKTKVENAIKVAQAAVDLRKAGFPVVGFDVTGDEFDNPIDPFAPALNIIKGHNRAMMTQGKPAPEMRIGLSIHAGETPYSGDRPGYESMRRTIALAWDPYTPVRLGHGIQLFQDPEYKKTGKSSLIEEIKTKGIGLEVCPKSNVQTGAVGYHTDHPAYKMLKAGIKVSISEDNQTVSNTSPSNEFVKLYSYLNVDHKQRKQFVLNGIDTAFIFNETQRQKIREDILKRFEDIDHTPQFQRAKYLERHFEVVKLANGRIKKIEFPPHPLWLMWNGVQGAAWQLFYDLRDGFALWSQGFKEREQFKEAVARGVVNGSALSPAVMERYRR